MPDNAGERRECLIILEKVDWVNGLLKSVCSDAEVSTYLLAYHARERVEELACTLRRNCFLV